MAGDPECVLCDPAAPCRLCGVEVHESDGEADGTGLGGAGDPWVDYGGEAGEGS